MAPVRLRTAEGQSAVESELDQQVKTYVSGETGREIPEGHEDVVLARLQSMAARIKMTLRKNVELSEDLLKETAQVQRGKRQQKESLKQTPVKKDSGLRAHSAEDMLALEKEVAELAARIEAHREEVPQRIAHRVSEHLQQMRPQATSTDPPETDAATPDQSLDIRLQPIPELPSLDELQEKLLGAAAALPGLRKRLEAAEAKMDRVVTAVEQDRLRVGPSLTEQVIAEHDDATGYSGIRPRGRGTKRAATAANLEDSPLTRSRARAQD